MKPYAVFVDDNFHYKDETERFKAGEFATLDEAITCCREIVDGFLHSTLQPDMSADALYAQYVSFGEDPFIRGPEANVAFRAWDYARQRCAELCPTSARNPDSI